MVPQEKAAAVTRGLREAFGVTEFEDIRMMTRGNTSALVFRIVVRGNAFLLKIIMRTNPFVGPVRQFTCMKAASEAGLAPRIWYTSVEDGISITDFVAEVPFPAPDALIRMPAVLRVLHALPPFPGCDDHLNTTCMFLMKQGPAVEGFIHKVQAANVLSKDESEELFAWYARVVAVYPRQDADMVSSHNDLFKPDNVLFDGERVWLVDWEAAFLNDRYADLAAVANLVVTSDAEERAYLQAYFGQPPDPYQEARFFLMRQIVHMFYTMVFLLLGSSGEAAQQSEKAPGFQAFMRRMWAGEVNLADRDTKTVYGRVHWEQLVQNMGQGRYDEALRIVADRHPRA
jgi:hypothetical protein